MLMEILMGTLGLVGTATGVSALVLARKQNGNGHSKDPWQPDPLRQPDPPPSPAEPEPQVNWPPELAALLTHITERLERSLERQEAAKQPEITPPEWAAHIQMDIAQMRENSLIEPLWPERLITSVQELGEKIADMAAIEAAPVVLAPPDNTALLESSGKLEKAIESLPGRISQSLTELARAPKIGGGSGSPPALPKLAPPNLPKIAPGMQPAVPQIPAAYVGGSVFAPAGEATSLLLLIQMQLSPNCPGTSAEFSLSADSSVFVGAASQIGGPLTATNYAFQLASGDPPRIYRSTYPGNNTPIGELQVLAPGGAWLHIEAQS